MGLEWRGWRRGGGVPRPGAQRRDQTVADNSRPGPGENRVLLRFPSPSSAAAARLGDLRVKTRSLGRGCGKRRESFLLERTQTPRFSPGFIPSLGPAEVEAVGRRRRALFSGFLGWENRSLFPLSPNSSTPPHPNLVEECPKGSRGCSNPIWKWLSPNRPVN